MTEDEAQAVEHYFEEAAAEVSVARSALANIAYEPCEDGDWERLARRFQATAREALVEGEIVITNGMLQRALSELLSDYDESEDQRALRILRAALYPNRSVA